MNTKTIVIIVCLCPVLILLGLVSMVAFRPAPGRPVLAIRMVGFTNDATGTRLAAFAISNGSPWSVSYSSHYGIQVLNDTNQARLAGGRFTNGSSVLRSGETQVLTMVAPTNQQQWRLLVSARKDEGVIFGMVTELLIEGQKLGLPTKYRRVRYGSFSEVVSE